MGSIENFYNSVHTIIQYVCSKGHFEWRTIYSFNRIHIISIDSMHLIVMSFKIIHIKLDECQTKAQQINWIIIFSSKCSKWFTDIWIFHCGKFFFFFGGQIYFKSNKWGFKFKKI